MLSGKHGADNRREAGQQGISGCSLPNAAPGNGEGGGTGKGIEEAQCSVGRTQAILRSLPERPQQSPQTSPPHNLAWLRGEVKDVLPGTVNTVRGVAERAGQVPHLVSCLC